MKWNMNRSLFFLTIQSVSNLNGLLNLKKELNLCVEKGIKYYRKFDQTKRFVTELWTNIVYIKYVSSDAFSKLHGQRFKCLYVFFHVQTISYH